MATYGNSCVFCHGAEGTGGHAGPPFSTARSTEDVQRIVSVGGNVTPAFGNTLDASQIANVSAWVFELARRAEEAGSRDELPVERHESLYLRSRYASAPMKIASGYSTSSQTTGHHTTAAGMRLGKPAPR